MRLLFAFLLAVSTQVNAQVAIVTHDRAPMRSAARAASSINATLLQGEVVEVRGERLDWLQVYDYRRERGGFVRASQVRRLALGPEEAPALLSVVRFLRTTPNHEALGIALATLYLQTAPADGSIEEGVEALDALGTFADRLAQRAAPELLEVAARYGVQFLNVEREGRVRVCYDGAAFRRVLALPATAEQRARAALFLTRRECEPGDLTAVLRMRLDGWRSEVLDRVEAKELAPYVRNRIHLRRAGIWASLAYHRARGLGEKGELASTAAQRAAAELASVDRKELPEEDRRALADATLRVNATRWAAVAAPPPGPKKGPHLVAASGGKPGETCVTLVDRKAELRRCTYGIVWAASESVDKTGTALSVAVQHTETHRESWVFRRGARGWTVRVVPPSST